MKYKAQELAIKVVGIRNKKSHEFNPGHKNIDDNIEIEKMIIISIEGMLRDNSKITQFWVVEKTYHNFAVFDSKVNCF